MNSSDITNSILIIIIFAIITIASILGIGIENIKKNWSKYRCQPMIMPFAGVFGKDTTANFESCMQGMQREFMGELLNPIYSTFSEMNNMGGEIGRFMTISSGLGNHYKSTFLAGTSNIFGTLNRLHIGVSMMSMKIQDISRKLMAVFVSVLYVILGMKITSESIWNGLPGEIVRAAT